jgi:hypothetical protein
MPVAAPHGAVTGCVRAAWAHGTGEGRMKAVFLAAVLAAQFVLAPAAKAETAAEVEQHIADVTGIIKKLETRCETLRKDVADPGRFVLDIGYRTIDIQRSKLNELIKAAIVLGNKLFETKPELADLIQEVYSDETALLLQQIKDNYTPIKNALPETVQLLLADDPSIKDVLSYLGNPLIQPIALPIIEQKLAQTAKEQGPKLVSDCDQQLKLLNKLLQSWISRRPVAGQYVLRAGWPNVGHPPGDTVNYVKTIDVADQYTKYHANVSMSQCDASATFQGFGDGGKMYPWTATVSAKFDKPLGNAINPNEVITVMVTSSFSSPQKPLENSRFLSAYSDGFDATLTDKDGKVLAQNTGTTTTYAKTKLDITVPGTMIKMLLKAAPPSKSLEYYGSRSIVVGMDGWDLIYSHQCYWLYVR